MKFRLVHIAVFHFGFLANPIAHQTRTLIGFFETSNVFPFSKKHLINGKSGPFMLERILFLTV